MLVRANNKNNQEAWKLPETKTQLDQREGMELR
jgi:hypothetical protein